jgi:membrane protein YqaA with SNARE-associated domain
VRFLKKKKKKKKKERKKEEVENNVKWPNIILICIFMSLIHKFIYLLCGYIGIHMI